MKAIEIKNVNKTYGNKIALHNINLDFNMGKIIGLLGPNGSGKTTLIKLINGLLTADSGEISVLNNKIGIASKKLISYLPERTYLDPNVKVSFMVNYFKDFYEDFDVKKAEDIISSFNIGLDEQIKALSKGMKEKVQLALVMSRNASVYILDEPIAGVDPAGRDYILHTILKNIPKESVLIISTHLVYEIQDILDEVIILSSGNVLYNGDAETLSNEHGSIDQWIRMEFRHV